jgi:hypothetical protein
MERISEGTGHEQSRSTRRSGDVCPALVLAVKVVCDKSDIRHEPNSFHVREFCTTELHRCCSLWRPGSNGAEAALAGQSSGMATLDLLTRHPFHPRIGRSRTTDPCPGILSGTAFAAGRCNGNIIEQSQHGNIRMVKQRHDDTHKS